MFSDQPFEDSLLFHTHTHTPQSIMQLLEVSVPYESMLLRENACKYSYMPFEDISGLVCF